MEKSQAKIRIDELCKTLAEHSRRYYVDNAPSISDYEFDQLMHELEALEQEYPEFVREDSPTRKVGSDLDLPVAENSERETGTGFIQREHRYPMLSLGNTYSIREVEEFSERADKILEGNKFSYCCELKFDGTAICLSYKGGVLERALTRGDGKRGDDVTENVRRISNVPQKLVGDFPDELEIRGEILMPYAAFDKLNQERAENEEAPFANPRNAASGSLKLINPDEVSRRGLYCTLYHIPAESISFATHDEALSKAASWGLPVSSDRRICNNISQIKEYIEHWDKARKDLPYATDGIVIKINELESQRTLGITAKSPRWAVAYKFKAEQACTPVLSIDYQVGRTGAVTPVANLKPVQLSGTVVKRATLNNEDWMNSLDLRIGDSVYVEKGGEIIPKITSVELSLRPEGAVRPEFPVNCPDCGTPLLKAEDEARWYCPNIDGCPTQIKGRLLHFTTRKAMNILCGEASVEQFYNAGIAKTPADFYDISLYQLLSLEGWQEKSARNFLDSVAQSVNAPFERVLFALGIRQVGESTARDLARHFGDIDSLMSAGEEQIAEVQDIGGIIAHNVFEYFRKSEHIEEIWRLRAHGLAFAVSGAPKTLSNALEGKSIVISGNFSISRDEMKELIAAHGGKAGSSISGKTDFLLAGSKPGPEKIRKCEELGIPMLSEEAFRALLPESKDTPSNNNTEEQLSLF